MEKAVILMYLFVTCSAAPVPKSQSNEIAAHANEALRLMEMYRMLQQQGIVASPFLPATEIPAMEAAPELLPAEPAEAVIEVNAVPEEAATIVPASPTAGQTVGDASEEEEDAKPALKEASVVAPPNSDEAEETEENEEAEEAIVIEAQAAKVPAVNSAPKAPQAAEVAVGEGAAEAAATNAAAPLADTTTV
ncbi:enamelin isoform X2 [Stigmatopora nigra]